MAEETETDGPSDLDELRRQIEREVRGNVRLGQIDDPDLDETVRDLIIDDDATEDDRPDLYEYLRNRIQAERAIHRSEVSGWPETTDCDRLDRATAALHDAGVVLWPVSPCCDTCTMGEFPDYIEFLAKDDDTLKPRLRGYAFFIEQGLSGELADGTEIEVFLGYGAFGELQEAEYEAAAVAIGHEVREALSEAGLNAAWDGDLGKKIALSMDWKRRPDES